MNRQRYASFYLRPRVAYLLAITVICAMLWHWISPAAYGAQLGPRALQLSNNEVSSTAVYQLKFDISTAGTLGSIEAEFCSNDPFPGTPCTPPGGLDVSSAALTDQAGPTGFSIGPGSTTNKIVLTRIPAPALATTASYQFSGVVNPSSSGSYFLRLQTFASDDATGPASDYGGIAFAITNGLSLTATVPPYLIFCTGVTISGLNCSNANGDYIDFGELSSVNARSGSSQMLVATNAELGYNISVNGPTLTSGNNAINALAVNDVSRPGTGQFGLNLRANSTPAGGSDPVGPGTSNPLPGYNQPNSFRFVTGDMIVSNATPDDMRKFTASYIANVSNIQAPGIYVSTMTYICLANF